MNFKVQFKVLGNSFQSSSWSDGFLFFFTFKSVRNYSVSEVNWLMLFIEPQSRLETEGNCAFEIVAQKL